MVQNGSIANTAPEISIFSRAPRVHLFDIASTAIPPHRHFEPEVNRVKQWAMRVNMETAEEMMFDSNAEALPPGIAIALMIAASVGIWGAIAGVCVALL